MEPLNYDKLPKKIKDILADHRVGIKVMSENIIRVEHAY